MAVLESSSSRPAGRETWSGYGVVARGPSIHVHQAGECGNRPKVESFIATTIISMYEQNNIIHLIDCVGIISRQTQGYIPQTNFWHACVITYLYRAESCVRS